MTHLHGFSGNNYDRWVEKNSSSTTFGKVQKQFWFTKSAVIRRLGKKEDEHVVASDAELDAKIELFKAIESSTKELQVLLAEYQNRLCILAQEENCLGRLLKEWGKEENSRAGKMMTAVGKSLSYTAQQRVAMRNPLVRLFQEVDTFQTRAVEDTSLTVEEMEKVRTEYRGALMWMKNISQDFNPEHYHQLEKFREVQGIVKQKKTKFDQIKIKSLQKIDLLAASRCNMFSHALILYQNNLITFSEKTAKTLNSVASAFKGYYPYRFKVIKELAEPEGLFESEENEDDHNEVELEGDDKAFFGDEYHDEKQDRNINKNKKEAASKNVGNSRVNKKSDSSSKKTDSLINLLDDNEINENSKLLSHGEDSDKEGLYDSTVQPESLDLLSDDIPLDSNISTQDLLKALFDSPVHESTVQSLPIFGSDFSATADSFSQSCNQGAPTGSESANQTNRSAQMFLPSQLIDFGFGGGLGSSESCNQLPSSQSTATKTFNLLELPNEQSGNSKILSGKHPCNTEHLLQAASNSSQSQNIGQNQQIAKKLDWYKVFQDIDPLSDSGNAIFGKLTEDRKC